MGYDRYDVWGLVRRTAVIFAILAGSQLGHALTYFARYGGDAARYQSAGVHGYYPSLAAGLGGSLGIAVMTGLSLVAAARCTLLAPVGYRPRATVRFLDVLALAFAVQLMVFAAQESIEALAGGQAIPSVGDLLLWGALGQLPAAALAALVIAWLLTRLEAAWTALVEGTPQLLVKPATSIDHVSRTEVDARRRLGSTFPAAFRRRGPPLAVQP